MRLVPKECPLWEIIACLKGPFKSFHSEYIIEQVIDRRMENFHPQNISVIR